MEAWEKRRFNRLTDDFADSLENKGILVIYGIGYAGNIVGTFLRNRSIPVAAYTVTRGNQEKKLNGISVYTLEKLLRLYPLEEIHFIIGATGANQLSIRKELENHRVYSYSEISEILVCEMLQENRGWEAQRIQAQGCGKEGQKHTIGFLTPGYWDTDYAEKRLIINKIDGAVYIPIPKETAEIPFDAACYERKAETYRVLMETCYRPRVYTPNVKLIHTFNAVCDTLLPWCASFETVMPRMWPETEEERTYLLQLAEYLKRPNCRALYALSKNAYEIQRSHLSSFLFSDEVDTIMAKTKILHPSQEVLITEEEFVSKHSRDIVHFIFIGRLFFIKGGREIIQALSKFEDRYDFKLTLISSFLYEDYFTNTSYEEMERCKALVKSKKWIEYYESLPNDMVLEKCKEATVGLLPSVAETYGYAVLEMQASGCPVVTTNIRAFPENNNQECGWICEIPVDELGRCSVKETAVWSKILERELERCFQEIFDHRDEIKRKGMAALKRIRQFHDPDQYQKELRRNLLAL